MKRSQIHLTYGLKTLGPLHLGTGQGRAGMNRGMLRDQYGQPYLSGSTIKGRARYAAIKICRWLGVPASEDSVADVPTLSDRPNGPSASPDIPTRIFGSAWGRCTLCFSDARLEPPPPADRMGRDDIQRQYLYEQAHGLREVRSGAARSRRLGTISQGRLYRTEVAPPGLLLRGTIRGHLECQDHFGHQLGSAWPEEVLVLWLALRLMAEDGAGGSKSAGCGRLAFAAEAPLHLEVDGTPFVLPEEDEFAALLQLLPQLYPPQVQP